MHCRKNVRDLSVGDVLFVPSGAAVAWRAKGMEDEAMVARFCYVDASNFDSVKTQLPIYAAVEVCRPHWCAAAYSVSSSPGYLVWPMLRPVLSRMTSSTLLCAIFPTASKVYPIYPPQDPCATRKPGDVPWMSPDYHKP